MMSSQAPSKEVVRRHLIVNYYESLAPSLRFSINNDPDAMVQLDGLRHVMSLGAYDIVPEEFFRFLRSVVAGEVATELCTHEGELVPMTGMMHDDGFAVLKDDSREYRFELAVLLSESLDLRLEKITTLFNEYTVSERAEKYWYERVKQSALTDDEYRGLEKILLSSVDRELERVRIKLDKNNFSLDDCLPEYEDTFAALLGNADMEYSFSEYHEKVYLPHCENLFQRGLVEGLKLVGPSCMLPDDTIVSQFSDFDDDELYDALDGMLDSSNDPYTLSLLLDICAYKLDKDIRFNALGCRLIEKLTGDIDDLIFQNFSIATMIVLNAMSKGHLQTQPLYYRRFAAWTWSGYIARLLSEFDFDRPKLLADLKGRLFFACTLAGGIERKETPYWSAEWFTADNSQGLTRRRIGQLLATLGDKEKDVPKEWQSIIESADKRISEKGSFPSYLLPGPFDELRHEDFKLLSNSSESKKLLEKFSSDASDIDLLADLRLHVNIFELEESLVLKIKECADRINNSRLHDVDSDRVLLAAQTLGYLAGVHQDPEMAESAVNLAHALTGITGGETALFECYLIIYSACGYSENKDFNAFIRDGIERLSSGELSQYQADLCLNVVERISVMDPSLRLFLGRAKAGLNIAKRHAH